MADVADRGGLQPSVDVRVIHSEEMSHGEFPCTTGDSAVNISPAMRRPLLCRCRWAAGAPSYPTLNCAPLPPLPTPCRRRSR